MFQTWKTGTSPAALSEDLFDGSMIVVRTLRPLETMVGRARQIVETVFETNDPVRAEAYLEPDQFTARAEAARKAIAKDREIDVAWCGVLQAMGFDLQGTYGDRMRLRIVPSRRQSHSKSAMPLAAHRDSWGACIMAQVNWWLPIYPISATRTMLVWPDLFRTSVANTSRDWNFSDVVAARKAGRKDYQLLPVTEGQPSIESGVPVLIEPGEMLVFSAAHLHGSVSDDSGLTRLGMDTRTFLRDDVDQARGAPNVDGQGQQIQWGWFKRMSDGASALDVWS